MILVKETYRDVLPFELGRTRANQEQYKNALKQSDRIIANLESFLYDWDVWLCPVVPISASTHRQAGEPIGVDGQQFPYLREIGADTTIFNLTGLPVIVLPLTQKKAYPLGCKWSEDVAVT